MGGAPDLSYYCHRHELEWKGRVYTDIAFVRLDEEARLIRCDCVNNTSLPQTLVLHYLASVHFPPLRTNYDRPILPARVSLPEGAVWVNAIEYQDLRYASPRPTDHLVPDGMYRGEVRDHGLADGNGVGRGFGREAGDRLEYLVRVPRDLPDAVLLLRCRTVDGKPARLQLEGLVGAPVILPERKGLQLVRVPVGTLRAGSHRVHIRAAGGGAVDLDGFCLCRAEDAAQVAFEQVTWNAEAEVLAGPAANTLRLRYEPLADVEYGLAWQFDHAEVRQFYTDELDRFMRRTVHDHVRSVLRDVSSPAAPTGHFTNVFLRPIALLPQSRQVVHGLVCSGHRGQVEDRLSQMDLGMEVCETIYRRARGGAVDLRGHPAGARHQSSQERMAATTLTNVVYPVYIRGTYIRHNTPGRWWDSLYTWDSGFIGLGLTELDLDRAIDCLNAYMTEPGDPHAAFVHHGSPVPTQFPLFLEIWNRRPDQELLDHFYPRLQQYYEFLAGKREGSTTCALQSNLLKTWDYFYNSGGWDDYPPQVYVHRQGLTSTVAPVVTTAQCIRAAKILRMAALACGRSEDAQVYERDIDRFAHALQTYAWDEDAGYFAYVTHSKDGSPTGILRYPSGGNYNRGLDGAYPLVAGICTDQQQRRILAHLCDPDRHWTPVGLSTVDQSAPYYRLDGYWNGAVWMPHQWFFWKAFLDLGQGELAWKVARTALEVWRREVEATYNCWEHFVVATGRGAGWHHFGGLSAPVLNWYSAYHRPGRLTTGFDVWVDAVRVEVDCRALEAELRVYGRAGRTLSVLASLDPGPEYAATWDGEPCTVQAVHSGVFYVGLPCGERGTLRLLRR